MKKKLHLYLSLVQIIYLKKIITNHKKNNPWSYLNIFNPDYQNSKTQSEIYTKAKEQFELMKNNSVIIKDSTKSFYIYKNLDKKSLSSWNNWYGKIVCL